MSELQESLREGLRESLREAIVAEVKRRWPDRTPVKAVQDPAKEIGFGEISEALNAPHPDMPTKRIPISAGKALVLLIERGAWGRLCVTAESAEASLDVRATCINVRDAVRLLPSIATEGVEASLKVLQGEGLLDAETSAALLALGETPCSWLECARKNFEGVPDSFQWGDIQAALEGK